MKEIGSILVPDALKTQLKHFLCRHNVSLNEFMFYVNALIIERSVVYMDENDTAVQFVVNQLKMETLWLFSRLLWFVHDQLFVIWTRHWPRFVSHACERNNYYTKTGWKCCANSKLLWCFVREGAALALEPTSCRDAISFTLMTVKSLSSHLSPSSDWNSEFFLHLFTFSTQVAEYIGK